MGSKVLWVLLGLLLVLLLGSPIAIGFAIERIHAELMREASSQADAAYEISGSLDRGLLISQAETVLHYRGEAGSDGFEIVLHHEIVHGPIPIGEVLLGRSPFHIVAAVVNTRFAPNEERLPSLREALGDRPLLELTSWIHFDLSARLVLVSPPIELADGRALSEGVEGSADVDLRAGTLRSEIRAGPFSLAGNFGELRIDTTQLTFGSDRSDEGDALAGVIEFGALRVSGPLMKSRLAPSRVEYTSMLVDGELDFGTIDVRLGDFVVEDADASAGLQSMTGLRMQQRTSRSVGEGHRDFELTVSFDEITGARRFGPGEMRLAVRNIDFEAIQGFQTAVGEIESQPLSEFEANMQKALAFEEWAPRILGPSPLIELEKLSLGSDAGELRADLRLGVDASEPSMLGNPFMVMALIQAELNFSLPASVMRELLANEHFCAAAPTTGATTGDRARPPAPPYSAPVMKPLFGGHHVDTSAAGAADGAVLQVLEAAGYSCQPMWTKLVAAGILIEKDASYELRASMQEGLPILNGVPVDPSLFTSLIPGL